MFIRPCYRKKNGKRHAYWVLMESYRTECGPRQRVVAYLGQLDEPQRLGVKEAAEGKLSVRQKRLFDQRRSTKIASTGPWTRYCRTRRPWSSS
jgi:hypothetical protein